MNLLSNSKLPLLSVWISRATSFTSAFETLTPIALAARLISGFQALAALFTPPPLLVACLAHVNGFTLSGWLFKYPFPLLTCQCKWEPNELPVLPTNPMI